MINCWSVVMSGDGPGNAGYFFRLGRDRHDVTFVDFCVFFYLYRRINIVRNM